MTFKPNRKFKQTYDLMCEIADKKGRVISDEQELTVLMAARFNDPREYAL